LADLVKEQCKDKPLMTKDLKRSLLAELDNYFYRFVKSHYRNLTEFILETFPSLCGILDNSSDKSPKKCSELNKYEHIGKEAR
jgi:hypothetical protein